MVVRECAVRANRAGKGVAQGRPRRSGPLQSDSCCGRATPVSQRRHPRPKTAAMAIRSRAVWLPFVRASGSRIRPPSCPRLQPLSSLWPRPLWRWCLAGGALCSCTLGPSHGGRPPTAASWSGLCHQCTLGDLIHAFAHELRGSGFRLAGWNLRWFFCRHTDHAVAKRDCRDAPACSLLRPSAPPSPRLVLAVDHGAAPLSFSRTRSPFSHGGCSVRAAAWKLRSSLRTAASLPTPQHVPPTGLAEGGAQCLPCCAHGAQAGHLHYGKMCMQLGYPCDEAVRADVERLIERLRELGAGHCTWDRPRGEGRLGTLEVAGQIGTVPWPFGHNFLSPPGF